MANVSINNITETWSSSGTTYTGIKYNVIDTASAAGSKLIDLQVGGSSKFSVGKDGSVAGASSITNTGDFTTASGNFYVSSFNTGFALLNYLGYYGFTSSGFASNSSTAADVRLYRDAANTLALRNGTNAQSYRIYLSYTDASNYSRFAVNTSANYYRVTSEAAGTGAKKPIVTDVYQSASDPTTSDIPDGTSTVWKNTTSGVVKLWVNNGGTLIGVALA